MTTTIMNMNMMTTTTTDWVDYDESHRKLRPVSVSSWVWRIERPEFRKENSNDVDKETEIQLQGNNNDDNNDINADNQYDKDDDDDDDDNHSVNPINWSLNLIFLSAQSLTIIIESTGPLIIQKNPRFVWILQQLKPKLLVIPTLTISWLISCHSNRLF